jgi:hypothetical protein
VGRVGRQRGRGRRQLARLVERPRARQAGGGSAGLQRGPADCGGARRPGGRVCASRGLACLAASESPCPRRRPDGWRPLGSARRGLVRILGARHLGPRPRRQGRSRHAVRIDAPRRRVRSPIDRGAGDEVLGARDRVATFQGASRSDAGRVGAARVTRPRPPARGRRRRIRGRAGTGERRNVSRHGEEPRSRVSERTARAGDSGRSLPGGGRCRRHLASRAGPAMFQSACPPSSSSGDPT